MSFELSTKYKSELEMPVSNNDRKRLAGLMETFMRYAPYSQLPLTAEKVETLQPVDLIADMRLNYRSRLDHGLSQTAAMRLSADDDSIELKLNTNPEISGLWQTPDGRFHTSKQAADHLREFLPEEAASLDIYDIPDPSAADIHRSLEKIPRILGSQARYLVEYSCEDFSGLALTDGPNIQTRPTLAIGSVTSVLGEGVEQRNYARLSAVYALSDRTIEYSQFVASDSSDSSKVGIRLIGNDRRVQHFAETQVHEEVIENLIRRLEDATEEAQEVSALSWRSF